jgi:hypothetical protein
MTGTEFSTAVEEINGGDPHRIDPAVSVWEFRQKPNRAETAMDDSPQDGYYQDHSHLEHMADSDRPFDHH